MDEVLVTELQKAVENILNACNTFILKAQETKDGLKRVQKVEQQTIMDLKMENARLKKQLEAIGEQIQRMKEIA